VGQQRQNEHYLERAEAQRAMAAGVVKWLWKFDDLFSEVSTRYL